MHDLPHHFPIQSGSFTTYALENKYTDIKTPSWAPYYSNPIAVSRSLILDDVTVYHFHSVELLLIFYVSY
jgi:hypothetical protein